MPTVYHNTPLGTARIIENDGHVNSISILDNVTDATNDPSPILLQVMEQLDEYFAGVRKVFDFPVRQAGTLFQQSVWDHLMKIGYGETISYSRLSEWMKNPLAIRAIAAANGRNNLWIVVPCHRVIGANGKLVGYAGGLWRKQWLIEHEAQVAGCGQTQLKF